jgi:hypothetical protein
MTASHRALTLHVLALVAGGCSLLLAPEENHVGDGVDDDPRLDGDADGEPDGDADVDADTDLDIALDHDLDAGGTDASDARTDPPDTGPCGECVPGAREACNYCGTGSGERVCNGSCRWGDCVGTCPTGTCCSGRCTDTGWDEANCGGCGVVCSAPSGTCCGGECVDVGSDFDHCGRCDHSCIDVVHSNCCDGICANTMWDEANCGRCGNRCRAGHECHTWVCR